LGGTHEDTSPPVVDDVWEGAVDAVDEPTAAGPMTLFLAGEATDTVVVEEEPSFCISFAL